MFSHLLSSKPKSNLINLFLAHPGRSFSKTELRASISCPGKLLNDTVRELSKMGFLQVFDKKKKKFYQINKHFALYPELVSFLRKMKKFPQDLLSKEASKAADCKFIALTGVFAGKPRIETDILFVGKVAPRKIERILKLACRFAEQEVGYTIFNQQEFEYRKIMNDRFVKNILENNPVVVVDRTKNRGIAKLVYKL